MSRRAAGAQSQTCQPSIMSRVMSLSEPQFVKHGKKAPMPGKTVRSNGETEATGVTAGVLVQHYSAHASHGSTRNHSITIQSCKTYSLA